MAIQKNMASAVSSCDEHITTIACFLPLQFEGCIPSLSNQQRHRRKCQGGWSWCAHTFEHSRTHSSTANSSSVSAVSHCLALVRFSCVMLERLPRVLPSATIELVDHRQGGAQHLVLEKSFRLGRRAGAAPRQWRRNRGLLYPGNLDMVTEDKATITLEKYREEVRRNNRGQIDCRPAIGSTATRICSELLRPLLLHAHRHSHRQTSRPVAPLRF